MCATKSPISKKKPVLFVITVYNELNYPGFRLSNEKYACYPEEGEVLIPGGEKFEIEDL